MDKDEILEMSRNENKQGDEMQKGVRVKASSIGGIVGAAVALIFVILELALAQSFGLVAFVGFTICNASSCATNWYNFAKTKEKKYLIGGIIETITTVIWFGLAAYTISQMNIVVLSC